jgi:hypothetical protein
MLWGRRALNGTKNGGCSARADGTKNPDVSLRGVIEGHYMIQPLVELYGGCMAVLKVSWCGILLGDRAGDGRPAGLDEGLLSFSLPHSRLHGESLQDGNIVVTNDSAPLYVHRPRRAAGPADLRHTGGSFVYAGKLGRRGRWSHSHAPLPLCILRVGFHTEQTAGV